MDYPWPHTLALPGRMLWLYRARALSPESVRQNCNSGLRDCTVRRSCVLCHIRLCRPAAELDWLEVLCKCLPEIAALWPGNKAEYCHAFAILMADRCHSLRPTFAHTVGLILPLPLDGFCHHPGNLFASLPYGKQCHLPWQNHAPTI